MEPKSPWLRHYGAVPQHLTYPDGSMYDLIAESARLYPKHIAYTFMGRATTYAQMVQRIHRCAHAFRAQGIARGDRVTLSLPNMPQAVECFYALNLIGAIPNMIHPLSSEGEIAFFLNNSNSKAAVTLDQFYEKFAAVREQTQLPVLIIASVQDALGWFKRQAYRLTAGRKISKPPAQADIVLWRDFLAGEAAARDDDAAPTRAADPAAILYSGGTTGTTKGILLSNLNFNALALQTAAMGHCMEPGRSMLAVMPMFHGFGLGVCIHTALCGGCRCILVPRFDAKSYAKLLRKEQPNYIAGVPTLYEAILRHPDMEGVDLSCLMGVFSGGDSLSVELKRKFDRFLSDHNATVHIREGFGTTECVTASCLTPYHLEREGSIGLPFPDTYYKIVATDTTEEQPYGDEGEICISGPTVMLEYIDQPEETASTLRRHADGRIWLHTGDLGVMDEDGFVYFRQRIKRMIVSSGYSIYPSQLENVIDGHASVQMSCVIGVPDPYKIQKVKAFIMLRPGIAEGPDVRDAIWAHCRKNIAKYAMPYEIEFRDQLPKTLVGKVAYTVLEAEETAKRNADAPEGEG